jgi:hypothetical protein
MTGPSEATDLLLFQERSCPVLLGAQLAAVVQDVHGEFV